MTSCAKFLTMYQFQNDLCSQSILNGKIRKMPPQLRPKWVFHVSITGMLIPFLIYFSNWPSKIAFVHDELSLLFSEKRFPIKDKVTTKVSTSSLSVNHSNSKTECPMRDEFHKTWNCNMFKSLAVAEQYETVKKT